MKHYEDNSDWMIDDTRYDREYLRPEFRDKIIVSVDSDGRVVEVGYAFYNLPFIVTPVSNERAAYIKQFKDRIDSYKVKAVDLAIPVAFTANAAVVTQSEKPPAEISAVDAPESRPATNNADDWSTYMNGRWV